MVEGDLDRQKRNCLVIVKTARDGNIVEGKFHSRDNVSLTYKIAARELVSEGVLEKGDHDGYRPGPNFDEALKKYGVE